MIFSNDMIVSKITHVTVVKFKCNDKSKMNSRPFHGIAFSLNGELIYRHNFKDIKLSGNTVVYLPKNSTYEAICENGGSFALVNFQVANEPDVNEFISIKVGSTDVLQREFTNMHRAFASSSKDSLYNNLSSLYKIFSVLIASDLQKEISPHLGKAIAYIENNISSPSLSNAEIAEGAGISEVYLRKLFSRNLSISPNSYIQNSRIEKAKLLLSETELPITEISEKCGYSCIYYFCTSFKKSTGFTPTEYRNNNSFTLF